MHLLGCLDEPLRKPCIFLAGGLNHQGNIVFSFFFISLHVNFIIFYELSKSTSKLQSLIILELPLSCSYVSCAPYHSIHPIVITFIIECFHLFILVMQRTCVVHLSLFNPQLKFRTSIYFSNIRTPIR